MAVGLSSNLFKEDHALAHWPTRELLQGPQEKRLER